MQTGRQSNEKYSLIISYRLLESRYSFKNSSLKEQNSNNNLAWARRCIEMVRWKWKKRKIFKTSLLEISFLINRMKWQTFCFACIRTMRILRLRFFRFKGFSIVFYFIFLRLSCRLLSTRYEKCKRNKLMALVGQHGKEILWKYKANSEPMNFIPTTTLAIETNFTS